MCKLSSSKHVNRSCDYSSFFPVVPSAQVSALRKCFRTEHLPSTRAQSIQKEGSVLRSSRTRRTLQNRAVHRLAITSSVYRPYTSRHGQHIHVVASPHEAKHRGSHHKDNLQTHAKDNTPQTSSGAVHGCCCCCCNSTLHLQTPSHKLWQRVTCAWHNQRKIPQC